MFVGDNIEISFSQLVEDEEFTLKEEFSFLDLNGDNKLDEREMSFFSSGGRFVENPSKSLNFSSFVRACRELDRFGNRRGRRDGQIYNSEKNKLYKILEATSLMFNGIQHFPENLQNLYRKAVEKVCITTCSLLPQQEGDVVSVNT